MAEVMMASRKMSPARAASDPPKHVDEEGEGNTRNLQHRLCNCPNREELVMIQKKSWIFLVSFFLFGIAVAIVTYDRLTSVQMALIETEFSSASNELLAALRDDVDFHMGNLESHKVTEEVAFSTQQIGDFGCNVSRWSERLCDPFKYGLQRDQFRRIAEDEQRLRPGVQAIEWIPIVTAEYRHVYEAMAQQIHGPDCVFTMKNDEGDLVEDIDRAEYYPVYFVEPFEDNELAFLYNLGSSDTRRESMQKAMHTLEQVATARINLVQEQGEKHQSGFLIFDPVQVRNVTAGFSLFVFNIGDLAYRAFEGLSARKFVLHIFDELSEDNAFDDKPEGGVYLREHYGDWLETLYYTLPESGESEYVKSRHDENLPEELKRGQIHEGNVYINKVINVADRRWVLVIHGNEDYWENALNSSPIFFCLAVLLLTTLIDLIFFMQAVSLVRRQIHDKQEREAVVEQYRSQKTFARILLKLQSTEDLVKQLRYRLFHIKTGRPFVRSYAIPDPKENGSIDEAPIRFGDILENAVTLEYMKDFCIQYRCGEALMFWLDINDFENNVADEDLKLRLQQMLEYYVKDDSPYQVNIPSVIKTQLLTGKCRREIFDETKREVLQLLEDNTWLTFKDTEMFHCCVKTLAVEAVLERRPSDYQSV